MRVNFPSEKTLDQLMTRIEKTSSGCWLWQGARDYKLGYGQIWFRKKREKAHRVFFMLSGNTIPQGTEIDHICRARQCVNPSHLRAVTHRENIIAATSLKTSCKHGHEFSPSNMCKSKSGYRICKKCRYLRIKAWRNRHPEQATIVERNSYRLRKEAWINAGVPCGTKGRFSPSRRMSVPKISEVSSDISHLNECQNVTNNGAETSASIQ